MTNMKNLSMDSSLAWRIAVNEAAAGKFQFIEKEHIFIGILNLKKLLILNPAGHPRWKRLLDA